MSLYIPILDNFWKEFILRSKCRKKGWIFGGSIVFLVYFTKSIFNKICRLEFLCLKSILCHFNLWIILRFFNWIISPIVLIEGIFQATCISKIYGLAQIIILIFYLWKIYRSINFVEKLLMSFLIIISRIFINFFKISTMNFFCKFWFWKSLV